MFFESLETELKNRLIAKLGTGVEVEVLPDNEQSFQRPVLKPRVTLAYASSEFEEVLSTNEINQLEKMIVEVIIQSRKLRGNDSVYSVFESVRKALIGFQGTQTKKIYARRFEFKDRQDNLWIYSFVIVCPTVMVEEYEDPNDPLGAGISINNSEPIYGNVQVP